MPVLIIFMQSLGLQMAIYQWIKHANTFSDQDGRFDNIYAKEFLPILQALFMIQLVLKRYSRPLQQSIRCSFAFYRY